MGTLETWRKAYGTLKDHTKVGLAHVNSDFKVPTPPPPFSSVYIFPIFYGKLHSFDHSVTGFPSTVRYLCVAFWVSVKPYEYSGSKELMCQDRILLLPMFAFLIKICFFGRLKIGCGCGDREGYQSCGATTERETPQKSVSFCFSIVFQSVIHVVRSIPFSLMRNFLSFSVFFKDNWFEGYLVVWWTYEDVDNLVCWFPGRVLG